MIKWLFFDIGNVILNDDPAMAALYQYIYDAVNQNGRKITFEELITLREQLILQNRDGRHYYTVGTKLFAPKTWQKEFDSIKKKLSVNWEKLSPLLSGVAPVIQNLSTRFDLGLIANQPREVVAILEKNHLMQYFKINAVSACVGYEKPDTRLFQYALEIARCEAKESVMIGDRIDNDIRPAKSVGMKTIWLQLPLELKGYTPQAEFEKLYFQSIRWASASQIPPQDRDEQPDFIAWSFDDLLKGIAYLEDKKHDR